MGKTILKTIVALIIISLIGFLVIMNLPKSSVKAKETQHTVAATQLFEEFTENEEIANKKYIGKVMEVSGIIMESEKDRNGATVVILETDDDFNGVACTLETSESLTKKIGETIKIKGHCSGKLMDVVLNKCTIVK